MATKANEKSRIPRAKRSSVVPADPLPAIKVEQNAIVETAKTNVVKKSRKSKPSKSEQKENVLPEKKRESRDEVGEARRHLSVKDINRAKGGSRSSAGDLDDSVFSEAASRLSSLASSIVKHQRSLSRGRAEKEEKDPAWMSRLTPTASSIVKHQRSLSRGRAEDNDHSGAFRPRRCSPPYSATATSRPPASTQPFLEEAKTIISLPDVVSPRLPDGVVEIDDTEDGLLEYEAEITAYLREREEMFVVSASFLEQGSVTAEHRAVLVDWLIQVQHYLKLSQETLYISISLLDMILEKRDVEPDKLQLVGITALYLGSKMEEYYPADVKKLLHLTENSYTVQDVFDMELVLLGVICFQVYVPTPKDFLPRLCRAALCPCPSFLASCFFLCDGHLPSHLNPATPPSLLAAAAVLAVGCLYHCQANPGSDSDVVELWTPTQQYYSIYGVGQVLPISQSMLTWLASPKYTGARAKYASRSQHGRLAAKPHFAEEVVERAREAVERVLGRLD